VQPGGSYLGVGVAEVDAERAKELKLKEERGVEIKSVDEDSGAAKAGLKIGDVILEYNGQRVEGQAQFVRLVQETPAGRNCTLLIWRNGSTQTVTAAIGARKGSWFSGDFGDGFAFTTPPMPPMPPMPPLPPRMPDVPRTFMTWRSPLLGIESESLGSQLAEYFGVKEGILVRSIVKGSTAEKAGLKAGDVIVKVDGQKVASPREISSALHSTRSRKSVIFTVVRNRKEINLNVTLDESSEWRNSEDREVL
jgi:serine protease Do